MFLCLANNSALQCKDTSLKTGSIHTGLMWFCCCVLFRRFFLLYVSPFWVGPFLVVLVVFWLIQASLSSITFQPRVFLLYLHLQIKKIALLDNIEFITVAPQSVFFSFNLMCRKHCCSTLSRHTYRTMSICVLCSFKQFFAVVKKLDVNINDLSTKVDSVLTRLEKKYDMTLALYQRFEK